MSDWEDDVGEGVGPNRHIDNAAPSYERTNDYKDDSDYNGRGRSNRGGGQSRSHYGEGDNYDQYQKQDESSNDYGSGNSRYRDNADRGDRGDRGGRGDWGGRGGRGGRSDRGDRFDRGDRGDRGDQGDMEDRGDRDDWGDRGDRGDRGGRGRGRGSFRGGRGGGRRFDSEDGGGDGGDEGACGGNPPKPRELYIPPDPTDNEQEMFGSGISTGINFAKYEKIDVKVSGNDVPLPIKSFESANLRKIVLENIQSSKYTTPTPIQKYTLPIVMSGRDVMGCAQTGSGKTASFLIPIINIILADPELIVAGDHIQPQCIIVTPTRELTIQIYNEARKFSHRSVLKVCVAYGGTGVRHQADRIMNGCHILVGTPGRLMDFLRRGRIQLCAIKFIVLDEADRMLDMGFLPEIEKLMGDSSMSEKAKRQTLMFSATFPETVQQVAAQFLDNYVFIAVGIVGGACSDVNQNFFEVERFKKKDKLIEILNEDPDYTGVIVFVETRRNADYIAALLSEQGIPTTSIHGDRLQREREEALRDFKQGTRGILVATGVASRGLDIKNVRHVINYDLPKSIDEYVHRIGRTGRVGNEGKATSFYDYQQDRPLAGDLVKILTDAGQPIPDFLQSVEVGGGSSDAYGGHDMRGDNYGGGGGNVAAAEPEEEW